MLYYYFQHWAQQFNTIFSFPKVVMTYSLDEYATESLPDKCHLNLIVYVKTNDTKEPMGLHFVWCGRQIAILENLKFIGLSGELARPMLF